MAGTNKHKSSKEQNKIPSPSSASQGFLDDNEDNPEQAAIVATYSNRGNQTVVRKSNEFIQNAMYNLNLTQQKLMLHIIAMIKPTDKELPQYEMTIYEFLKLCGINPHSGSMYQSVRKNVEEIAKRDVQWIRIEGTQKIAMFRWFNSFVIDQETGKIYLTLSPLLKPHLIQLKELYTTMDITYIMLMKSQYSVRIYELCKSYQHLYLKNKSQGKPLLWSVEQLKQQIDFPLANWAHMRRIALDKAKSEINGHTDIIFDYEVAKRIRNKVSMISVRIDPVSEDDATKNKAAINDELQKRNRHHMKMSTAMEKDLELDEDPTILELGYGATPDATIPYSFGPNRDQMRDALMISAEPIKLKDALDENELEAVKIIIDTLTTMAGTVSKNEAAVDGGNKKVIEAINEIIFDCKTLSTWLIAIAKRYATKVIPAAQGKAAPIRYLSKALLEDVYNYKLYVKQPNSESDDSQKNSETVYEAEFAPINVVEEKETDRLTPQDAATGKSMQEALKRFIDEEALMDRLTQGQKDAYQDILQSSVFFCRRRDKNKDAGMIEGNANMSFLNSLNKFIERYGSLTPLFEAMAINYDYGTFWKKMNNNPKVRNPKLVFQSEIEKSLLMPFSVVAARQATDEQPPKDSTKRDVFNQDWNELFE